MRSSRILKLTTIATAALTLGACGGISQRAIANGAAMGLQQPLQYQARPDMASMRQTYYMAAPLTALSRRGPYTPMRRPRY